MCIRDRLKGVHHRALLVGRDASEDSGLLDGPAERSGILEPPRVDRQSAPQPQRVGHGAHRGGIVARDDLDLHALLGEVGEGIGGVRPDLLLQHDERGRRNGAGRVRTLDRDVAAPQEQDALAGGADLLGSCLLYTSRCV